MSHCTGIDRTLTRTRYSSSLGEWASTAAEGFVSKFQEVNKNDNFLQTCSLRSQQESDVDLLRLNNVYYY